MNKDDVMDMVIEFFSGTVIEDVPDEVICIMNKYSIEWNKTDATYDTKEGEKILDKIIDDCVVEIMNIWGKE